MASTPVLPNRLNADSNGSYEDETALITSCRQGQTAAYALLYTQHVGKIYALCLRLCNDVSLAEDLTQEAFIKAWQKLDQFRGDSQFSTWLYRLSSNLAISHLRQRKTWQPLPESNSSEYSSIEIDSSEPQKANEHRHDIETVLASLPDQARSILILHEIVGYQHNEISEITGIAIGTCKSQLHRARKLLQERFA